MAKYDVYSHKNIVVRIFQEHWARFKEFHSEYITEDIEVIQTAGRASTWNPHLHLLVTEGRLDKEGSWHNGIYLEYETLRKKWMYNLLTMLKERMGSRRGI